MGNTARPHFFEQPVDIIRSNLRGINREVDLQAILMDQLATNFTENFKQIINQIVDAWAVDINTALQNGRTQFNTLFETARGELGEIQINLAFFEQRLLSVRQELQLQEIDVERRAAAEALLGDVEAHIQEFSDILTAQGALFNEYERQWLLLVAAFEAAMAMTDAQFEELQRELKIDWEDQESGDPIRYYARLNRPGGFYRDQTRDWLGQEITNGGLDWFIAHGADCLHHYGIVPPENALTNPEKRIALAMGYLLEGTEGRSPIVGAFASAYRLKVEQERAAVFARPGMSA